VEVESACLDTTTGRPGGSEMIYYGQAMSIITGLLVWFQHYGLAALCFTSVITTLLCALLEKK